MGCNAAKNVAVIPLDGNAHSSNGEVKTDRYDAAPNYIDLDPGEIENAMVNNVLKAGNGMSFDITFDESEDKQPPKRIIELQEAENKEPPSLEKLQEKLEEAELRRQQL
ncbi:uncharacterized protein LOC109541535 isoform X2 [Dendroctonus ponderosae]|uniref:uncharacterized protein LOC109541535 isoform X2 n=1 Tax=Dendroctonus ponderosae TaxID=77166 RepID=UPI002035B8FE|nr:uncharacterized protein LOC109541535 isoform X2 [Dendroctonus ponderosae]